MKLQRLGLIMKPEPGNPNEVEGTLNPAAVRGTDGQLYLFPRLVAKGNYSRIGIVRVVFNEFGDPCGVVRLGIALEPEADYERLPDGSGGCEDARVSFVAPLRLYVMTYTALSVIGPRIALAVSRDLFHWKRIGLAVFEPYRGIDFANVNNKDAAVFPVAIPNHAGKLQLAMLHRPLFPGTLPEDKAAGGEGTLLDLDHESIWISFCPMPAENPKPDDTNLFNSHQRLATPMFSWEILKIGAGTPPVLTRHGWLIIHHGVSQSSGINLAANPFCYSAGIMVLSAEHPRVIRYRSPEPVLIPSSPDELVGAIANVVFPTGIDQRIDLGTPDRFDIYYGMADSRIGVARLNLPKSPPESWLQ